MIVINSKSCVIFMSTFQELVDASNSMKEYRIAENTKKVYMKCLQRYLNVAKEIPGFPDPENITSEKARVFIEKYRQINRKTTYGYIRDFVTSFAYWCRENNVPNFTLENGFRDYLNGLKRVDILLMQNNPSHHS